MGNKLFDQVGGIIAVRLKGKNQEKVINMALTRGIYLWDIRKNEEGLDCKVRTSGYQALKNIAAENNFELNIIDRQGLPIYKTILKRRAGLVVGALIFIMALYLMSSFVWFINVTGNNTVDKNRIILTAAKYGVYQGAPKWTFSRNKVESAMLRDLNEISYIELNITGVKANIKVVEKIIPKDEITGPCHMVALKDGVTDEILVLEGQAQVKPGDVVGKGDILISGIIFTDIKSQAGKEDENNEPYFVRARGDVKARVWYEGYGECQLRSEKRVFTGKEHKKTYLETPWKTFGLTGSKDDCFSLYTSQMKKKDIKTRFGEFGLYRLTRREQLRQVTEYSETEAVEIARDKAMQVLIKKLGQSQKITDSKVEILSAPSDSILRIKVSAETIEDIAIPQPINVSENSN